MSNIKRLPDAEFEIMRIIWHHPTPITTMQIVDKLGEEKKWKPQTVLTMLVRLVEKNFLTSGKNGRERNYTPVISETDYMQIETGDFISRYRGNSVGSLIKTMYDGKNITDSDLEELKLWLKKQED
ncbi:MAG: BlaI/MecI/CopY family transcriptional regulator [Defluviitaleaceae bacterium]|nr:BlaI/MecI/CopY family transcriptional regulator [Defluviitaleaceae bacterium]